MRLMIKFSHPYPLPYLCWLFLWLTLSIRDHCNRFSTLIKENLGYVIIYVTPMHPFLVTLFQSKIGKSLKDHWFISFSISLDFCVKCLLYRWIGERLAIIWMVYPHSWTRFSYTSFGGLRLFVKHYLTSNTRLCTL